MGSSWKGTLWKSALNTRRPLQSPRARGGPTATESLLPSVLVKVRREDLKAPRKEINTSDHRDRALQARGSLWGRTGSLFWTCWWRAVLSPSGVATSTRPLPPSPLCPVGSGRLLPLGSQQWETPELQEDLARAPGPGRRDWPTPSGHLPACSVDT